MKDYVKKRQLKNMFVYPRLQFGIVFGIFALVCVNALIAGTFQYIAISNILDSVEPSGAAAIDSASVLSEFLDFLVASNIAVVVFCSAINIIVALVFMHKITGPLHKLHKYFEEVASNPALDRKISFRKNDLYKHLVDAYNKRFEVENTYKIKTLSLDA